MFNFEQHFKERHLDPEKYRVYWDDIVPEASFLLFNTSGQLVGYQKYRPLAGKQRNNVEGESRYYTYFTGESKRKMIGLFGMETLYFGMKRMFVCEGTFDAVRLHNLGLPCVAAFSNNPKHLKAFLSCFPCEKIVVCDGDGAGSQLAKYGDKVLVCPNDKDLGDMTEEELNEFMKEYL